jgi:uncharacterized protein (DUF779 family)
MLSGRQPVHKILDRIKLYKASSIFGFSYINSPLYGGRSQFDVHTIPKETIDAFQKDGITFDIALSNHHFNEALYKETIPLLEEHYKEGNGIVVVNNRLARVIRRDFPKYKIKASCIRDPRSLDSINRSLELYDEIAIHPQAMRDTAFIKNLPEKHRMILFGGIGCLLDCSNTVCFPIASKVFAVNPDIKKGCAKLNSGYVSPFYWFDWENSPLFEGFNKIKLELPQKHQFEVRLSKDWPNK